MLRVSMTRSLSTNFLNGKQAYENKNINFSLRWGPVTDTLLYTVFEHNKL